MSENIDPTNVSINFESLLQKATDEESKENVVYSIREELMDKVMDEINKNYIEKQTIRFVVQCCRDALMKFLSFRFYFHDPAPILQTLAWKPDGTIPPSPKDTWAAGATTIRPAKIVPKRETKRLSDETCECVICDCLDEKIENTGAVFNINSFTTKDTETSEIEGICECPSSDLLENDVDVNVEILYERKDTPRIPENSNCTTTSQLSCSDLQIPNSSIEDEILVETPSTVMLTEKAISLTSTIEYARPVLQRDKIRKSDLMPFLPPIEVPEPTFRPSKTGLLSLPPLRAVTNINESGDRPPDKKEPKLSLQRKLEKPFGKAKKPGNN